MLCTRWHCYLGNHFANMMGICVILMTRRPLLLQQQRKHFHNVVCTMSHLYNTPLGLFACLLVEMSHKMTAIFRHCSRMMQLSCSLLKSSSLLIDSCMGYTWRDELLNDARSFKSRAGVLRIYSVLQTTFWCFKMYYLFVYVSHVWPLSYL